MQGGDTEDLEGATGGVVRNGDGLKEEVGRVDENLEDVVDLKGGGDGVEKIWDGLDEGVVYLGD